MALLTSILGFFATIAVAFANDVPAQFRSYELVPDILRTAPNDLLSVRYGDKTVTQLGVELTPTQVKDAPEVGWSAEPDKFYTLVMVDPDAPSRKEPKFREILHWLVGNVPGSDLTKAETIAGYYGSHPPKDGGIHRYALVVFKQPGKLDYSSEQHIESSSREGRFNFSVQKFADKYNMGTPIAGNMFQAQAENNN